MRIVHLPVLVEALVANRVLPLLLPCMVISALDGSYALAKALGKLLDLQS